MQLCGHSYLAGLLVGRSRDNTQYMQHERFYWACVVSALSLSALLTYLCLPKAVYVSRLLIYCATDFACTLPETPWVSLYRPLLP